LQRAPLHVERQPERGPIAVVVNAARPIEFDFPYDLFGCPEHHVLPDERRFVLVAVGDQGDVHWLWKTIPHHADILEQIFEVTPVFDRGPDRSKPLIRIFVDAGAPKHEKARSRLAGIGGEGLPQSLAERFYLAVWP